MCARKLGIFRDTSTLPDGDDIIITRENGNCVTNVKHVWVYHSPTGFEFGYGGSGPADLALNILLKMGLTREKAWRLHQDFKWKFVATLPQDKGGRIRKSEIAEWIRNQKETKDDVL